VTVDRPIYVAGLERSGTSLIFALLASHPNIAMSRRTNLWRYFYGQYGDLAIDADLERCLAVMKRYKRLQVLNLDFDRVRADFVRGTRTYGRLFGLIGRQVAEAEGKPRWGDKSLLTERWTEQIFEAFPDAVIVHMVRDPRDRFASSKTRWKTRRGGVGAGIAEWNGSARLGLRNQARYAGRYRVVRYEDLATDPRGTMAEVCAAIGEEFTEDLLAMHGAPSFRDQGSNSSYGRRDAGSIATDSIGRYRDVLSGREAAFMEIAGRSPMGRLDYGRTSPGLGGAELTRLACLDVPLEAARYLAWSARDGLASRRRRGVPSYRLADAGNG
jgi:hypothetical protein